jgi:hypothetical protein
MLDTLTQFSDKVEINMGNSNIQPMIFKQDDNEAMVLPVRIKDDPFAEKEVA